MIDITFGIYTKDRYQNVVSLIKNVDATAYRKLPMLIVEDQPVRRLRDDCSEITKREDLWIIENPTKSSCAHLWNQLIISSNTRYALICMDDIEFKDGWLERVEQCIAVGADIVLLSNWAVFVIDKKIIPMFGYFDERFVGGCFEDVDASFRLQEKKPNHVNLYDENILTHLERRCGVCWDYKQNEIFFGQKWANRWDGVVDVLRHPRILSDVDWYPAYTESYRLKYGG